MPRQPREKSFLHAIDYSKLDTWWEYKGEWKLENQERGLPPCRWGFRDRAEIIRRRE